MAAIATRSWGRLIIKAIGVIVLLILWVCCIQSTLDGETFVIHAGDMVVITFFIFPYLIMGALYGYVISLTIFALTYFTSLFFDMDNAYKMSIYLVATLCFSLFSQFYFFLTKKGTVIAATATLCATSLIEFATLTVLAESDYNIQNLYNHGIYLTRDLIIIFALGFALHFYLTKANDMLKLPFPLAQTYTKAYMENQEIRRKYRKTRVSAKLTAIIMGLEIVMSLFVGIYMIVLFPDIKNMIMSSINEGNPHVFQTESGYIAQDEVIKGFEKIDFRFGAAALSLDIKMMLMLLCVGVPMAALSNYYTKAFIGGPLGEMSDFLVEYAEADDDKKLEVGKKADKIVVRTHDEIEVVNESVKATVKAVEEYITHIKAEKELEKELEVAQKASEAKSSFLSNMSHEIRTPINAVLGMNEMILRECSDPQIVEYAQNVKSAGASLLSIVNDILDFSKIEAGKMDILPVEYNLSSMINDLINMISVKAGDKGLTLNVNVDEKIPDKLFGDEVRVKQCATNVLTNAVKYTEEGSVTMNVTFREADDDSIYLGFQVVDTGIGIKEEDLNKLFSPFERIEEIRNRTIEGTGLGMSIVKKLLAMMDTRLSVKSVYGEGSDFSFEVVQKVVDAEPIGDFKEKYRKYLESLDKYHEKFHAPDTEILVVDDTAMNLTVVKGLLKSTKIKVDTAESGRQTLDMVTKKRYDVIFIDHRMPEMDGLETLAAMKELDGNLCEGVPCIALTANAGAGARDEYLAAGFDDYLSKPVNGEQLEDMLRNYLPPEKIQEVSADEEDAKNEPSRKTENGEKNSAGEGAVEDIPADSFLYRLEGIDLGEALKNCGSVEVLEDVARQYRTSIASKADDIERFASEKDFRNFTVAVHALKSSSRLVGAMELSSQAAYLEQCGNNENGEEIAEKTPALLELYRSYEQKLSAAQENADDSDLPEIGEDELKGAFSDMKELLDAYDFDTADGIMNMLSSYRIPDAYREKYAKIKELMAAVDRDALLEIL